MNTKSKYVLIGTIAYIYIPIVIFLLGFVKIIFALPTILILGFFLYKMEKSLEDRKKDEESLYIRKSMLIFIALLLIVFCVAIGWGGWFPQAGDWYKHNAVLHDLSERSWPVYYKEKEFCMLTYYIGQYLIPALVGKITHSFHYAQVAMFTWGIIGVFIVYVNLVRIVKAKNLKMQILTLIILLLFNGATLLAQCVLRDIYPNTMYSDGDRHWVIVGHIMLQFRSNMVMLRWVFPQCIAIWLITELFLEHYKKIEFYVLLFFPALLFGTFSFLTFVILASMMFIYQLITKKEKKAILWQCFSLSNIFPALSMGIILFFYFLGYIQVEKPDYLNLSIQRYGIEGILVYIIFCFFLFGIYTLCIWKKNRKNPMFYFMIIILCLIPLFKMGMYNDFVMCVSIPALFILMTYVIQFLFQKMNKEETGIKKGIIIVVLIIGAWYPLCEIRENIVAKQNGNMSADDYGTMSYFTDRNDPNITDDLKYNYYTYELENSIFYKVFAKNKIE